MKANGSVEKTVVGSVVESRILDSENEAEYSRLNDIFAKDSLQMVSFTITEKGYSLVNGKGEMLPAVTEDFAKGPEKLTQLAFNTADFSIFAGAILIVIDEILEKSDD